MVVLITVGTITIIIRDAVTTCMTGPERDIAGMIASAVIGTIIVNTVPTDVQVVQNAETGAASIDAIGTQGAAVGETSAATAMAGADAERLMF